MCKILEKGRSNMQSQFDTWYNNLTARGFVAEEPVVEATRKVGNFVLHKFMRIILSPQPKFHFHFFRSTIQLMRISPHFTRQRMRCLKEERKRNSKSK
jgi:hypothetical protein